MFKAAIIADSISPIGVRLTTFELTYPRLIHQEVLTHRVFSRNSGSSRAVPVKRQIDMVLENPYIPFKWTSNRPGMVGGEEIPEEYHEQAVRAWLRSCHTAIESARELADLNIHKQHVNRLLEPYAWQTVVLSGTEFENFFTQRIHPDAQPEFDLIARLMRTALSDSVPDVVDFGEWHLPYVDEVVRLEFDVEDQKKISVARCAGSSYLKQGTDRDPLKDIDIYNRLVVEDPPHWSPTEHVATPATLAEVFGNQVKGNFGSWHQVRHWESHLAYMDAVEALNEALAGGRTADITLRNTDASDKN